MADLTAEDVYGLIGTHTPIDELAIKGRKVYVKREDMCAPYPGPGFSKIRGLAEHLLSLKKQGIKTVGILSTPVSRAGWGVSYIAKPLGMKVFYFYPEVKSLPDGLPFRHYCEESAKLGAEMMPMKGGRQSILWCRARNMLEEKYGDTAYMIKQSLGLEEAIRLTAAEVCNSTPDEVLFGSIVVAIGSGTICAGLLKGLIKKGAVPDSVVGVRVTKRYGNPESIRKKILRKAGMIPSLRKLGRSLFSDDAELIVDSLCVVLADYEYYDRAQVEAPEFPCDPWYDLKAWEYLVEHIDELTQPVLFWNIG